MFLEDCCLQVDTSSLVQSGWVGLQVKDLPLPWPSCFYHLVRIISGRRCCLVTLVTMSELSHRQLCYTAEVVVSPVLAISAWLVTMSSCQSLCLISSITVSGLGRQAMNQNMWPAQNYSVSTDDDLNAAQLTFASHLAYWKPALGWVGWLTLSLTITPGMSALRTLTKVWPFSHATYPSRIPLNLNYPFKKTAPEKPGIGAEFEPRQIKWCGTRTWPLGPLDLSWSSSIAQ
jgi:hypothetical protein